MKKSKIIAVALVVLMMMGALLLVSCKDKCDYDCGDGGVTCSADSSCAVVKATDKEIETGIPRDENVKCDC